jgi:hypothetical protein
MPWTDESRKRAEANTRPRKDRPMTRTMLWRKLVPILAAGKTQREASQIAGCNERTVRRYNADPVFRGEVEEAKREQQARINATWAEAQTAAIRALQDQCSHPDPWVRQKAAIAVAEFGRRYREMEQEDRIAALEERARDLLAQR